MGRLRIVFMGTPELACACLQRLLDTAAFEVAAVVAQPDRPKGRHLKLQPPPTKELATRAGIPVFQPARARDPEFIAQLTSVRPELIAVAAFGQILPKALLDLPQFGCMNVHTSLLPRYRGAAPIQWALLNGDTQTGVTIMKMDVGLDTGDILAQESTPISIEDDAQTLHDRLALLGATLLARTIPLYITGDIQPYPQPAEGVTYAPKIKKEDGRLSWSETAEALSNRVRALVPWPGAFTFMPGTPHPLLLKIWRAEPADASGAPGQILNADRTGIVVGCGRKALRLLELQLEGGKRLTAEQFLAGHRVLAGQQLG